MLCYLIMGDYILMRACPIGPGGWGLCGGDVLWLVHVRLREFLWLSAEYRACGEGSRVVVGTGVCVRALLARRSRGPPRVHAQELLGVTSEILLYVVCVGVAMYCSAADRGYTRVSGHKGYRD